MFGETRVTRVAMFALTTLMALSCMGQCMAQEGKLGSHQTSDFANLVVVAGSIGEPNAYYDRRSGRKAKAVKVQLEPRGEYAYVSPFREGLCPAKAPTGKKIGYVDMMAEFVIEPQFDEAWDFCEGRAVVKVGGQMGMIDRLGRWVVKPGTYDWISPCRHGRCVFRTGERKYGYLDRDGREVIPATYKEAQDFWDGLGLVEEFEGNRFYLDCEGAVGIRPPKGYMSGVFSEGMARAGVQVAAVERYGPNARLWGFMNRKGEIVIEPRFLSVGDFQEGLAAVSMTDNGAFIGRAIEVHDYEADKGGWGFIDATGKIVIPLTFRKVGGFSEGLARFLENGKWGYIDRAGKVVIPARFEIAGDFDGGLAVVKAKGRVAFIDHTGAVVIQTGEKFVFF